MKPREQQPIPMVCFECHSLKSKEGHYKQISDIEYNLLVQAGKLNEGYCPPCLDKIIKPSRIQP